MATSLEQQPRINKLLVGRFLTDVFGARNADAVTDYVAPDLVQHGADVPDGAQAFAELLRREFDHGPTVDQSVADAFESRDPVFGIGENDLVCVCHYVPQPDPDAPGTTFDHYAFTTYRIRDGRITERWPSLNKIAPPRLPAPGTPTRTTTVSSLPSMDIEANKRLVVDFYRCVFDAQNPDAVKEFVAADYLQHVSHYPPGRAGLEEFVRSRFPNGPLPPPAEPLIPPALIVAEGDIVVVAALLPQAEPDGSGALYPYYMYDAYRVRGQQLVEHWSGITKSAPPKPPGPPPAGRL
ncbi:nuclear transport factor 2 family protein [Streptomyces pseudovenezuelae]|uniref:SnoaL-like aldol condensation-catalyzing enzyme n=1 Tax=Streptomyces pseudovenezuelae TaxID=67350 RepID=A0ABT6LTC2_9ACTN|nr:nuclear transport factor 2 family protein [Streptomyces pseudovenezuelae]MDH6219557.1 putative SnoaL-like aldol condensation-catalyzing enzyme [Streptomyces pseudovenezuelae]